MVTTKLWGICFSIFLRPPQVCVLTTCDRRVCDRTVAGRILVDLRPPQVRTKKWKKMKIPWVWSWPCGEGQLGAKAPSLPLAREGQWNRVNTTATTDAGTWAHVLVPKKWLKIGLQTISCESHVSSAQQPKLVISISLTQCTDRGTA